MHVQFVRCIILPAVVSVAKTWAASATSVPAEAKAAYGVSAHQTRQGGAAYMHTCHVVSEHKGSPLTSAKLAARHTATCTGCIMQPAGWCADLAVSCALLEVQHRCATVMLEGCRPVPLGWPHVAPTAPLPLH